MHTYIHAHIHTCTHTYMHTYIHTYIHTYMHSFIGYVCIHICFFICLYSAISHSSYTENEVGIRQENQEIENTVVQVEHTRNEVEVVAVQVIEHAIQVDASTASINQQELLEQKQSVFASSQKQSEKYDTTTNPNELLESQALPIEQHQSNPGNS